MPCLYLRWRINRNIVECKFVSLYILLFVYLELIETLWNVNAKKLGQIAGGVFGINRNIVECKYIAIRRAMMEEKELIETLWNVNMFQPTSCTKKRTELIETLWNVNVNTK